MNKIMITRVHQLRRKIARQRRYQYHKDIVKQILKDLENVKGPLKKELIKLCDEYSKDVLGWSGYAPWLYAYSAINNEFKEGWIPDNYFHKVVLPAIDGGYGNLSDHKAISKLLFKSDSFPDIAYFINGLFLTRDHELISEKYLKEILYADRDIIVYKKERSAQGKGIYIIPKSAFNINEINKVGNGVFQYYIDQHPFFSTIMPNSVATIRITTYLQDNRKVSIRGSYLRLGRSSEKSIRWSSNILVPIDLAEGTLNNHGYYPNFVSLTKHPDTKVKFANKQIPSFNKCCSIVLDLHNKFPFGRCIGWDMVVDSSNNVKIMEWNGGQTDIKVHEAIQGPCFSDLGWETLWKQPL